MSNFNNLTIDSSDDESENENSSNDDSDSSSSSSENNDIIIGGIGSNEIEEGEIEENGSDDDSENDISDEENNEEEPDIKIKKSIPNKTKPLQLLHIEDENDEEYESDDENYLKKFDTEINKSYIDEFHPECLIHNYEEVTILSQVVRDNNNIIIDPFHKTIPFLTKYEKTRILGQRAKQIESGSLPFVKLPENIIDGYVIAELELQHKKIPFIIRRPIPGGAFEYWNVKDLENISF
jgi:DNA-directed RNA polymerase subunit K/omega